MWGSLTWLVGLEGPLFDGVDDVGHSNVGMETSMIGHLGLLHIGTIADSVDVVAALHLEVLIHPQGAIAGQLAICQEKPT